MDGHYLIVDAWNSSSRYAKIGKTSTDILFGALAFTGVGAPFSAAYFLHDMTGAVDRGWEAVTKE